MGRGAFHEIDDRLNGLLEVEVGGVDRGDALSGGHEVDHLGVAAIPLPELVRRSGGLRVVGGTVELRGAPGNSNRLIGGQEDADVGIGRDDRRDVPPLDDDPVAVGLPRSAAGRGR